MLAGQPVKQPQLSRLLNPVVDYFMDEDSCATNLLIRDARMQALVKKEWEPITPWIDRIKDFYKYHNTSTVLVIGGCGTISGCRFSS